MNVYTTETVARMLGVRGWQIRRAFDLGLVPPADRLGIYRVVREAEIPALADAMRTLGYMPPADDEAPVTASA